MPTPTPSLSPLSSSGSCPGQAEPLESEDREGREGRGRTKGFGTRAGRRATRRAGRRGSRRGRLNLTFKKKEKRRKAHIVSLDSRICININVKYAIFLFQYLTRYL